MGNQIATAKAPNEILPVERYFPLLPATIFEKSLGSTRFLKVAKAKNTSEQQQVVKVFVIQDPSFSLKHYAHEADYITDRLGHMTNCLPYQYNLVTDKAAFLVRQYIKYNLYDRISTKPFFTPIEKKWIAFQLLSALSQCHSQNICHGDIKSENVLITSWNWVLLTDFAHFKPAHLPENNPSDYNYFFDTSRRRTCYIAPERFQLSLSRGSEVNLFEPLTGGDGSAAHSLTHAMDIFSVGCVLIELFSEGKVPFNLSQLLSYRNGAYSLWKILDTISDRHIKELLQSMTQKNPSHRLSSEEYLMQQKGKGFPVYFYTFLKSHIQSYGSLSVYPDERISKLRKELPTIIKNTGVTKGQDGHYEPLVIILEILTSAIRELKFCEGKLNSLSLLLELTEYLPTDITLERVIPYMMYLLEDSIPKVNAEAIRVVTTTLSRISFVPRGEANLFPDYIFQSLDNLANPNNVLVKVALAENIAVLAETALRFLNLSQASLDIQHNPIDYEAELRTLQGLIQVKVVALLSDSDNSVKRAMMHFSIAKLAIIFGKQKASDIILSHMITFLNDKQDWQLRAEFFRCVVGVASYIGWQSTTVLKPLLEQGLNDTEEFVIRESLQALNSLLSVQLIEKHLVIKLLEQICPLLCHPNHWIRYGVVACVTTIANIWSVADVHCNISPIIRPYLTQQAQQVNRLDVLLHCLHDPVPRPVLDFLIKSSHLNKYFNSLEDRRLQRNIAKLGQLPSYTPQEDVVNQMSKKLFSFGLSEEFEDRLLRMKDFIIKLNIQHKVGISNPDVPIPGSIDISLIKIQRRHADLIPPQDVVQSRTTAKPKSIQLPESVQTPDVRALFTGTDVLDSPTSPPQAPPPKPEVRSLTHQPSTERLVDVPDRGGNPTQRPGRAGTQYNTVKQSRCKLDLRTLVHHKRDEYADDYRNRASLVTNLAATEEGVVFPSEWKPRGILVAHSHEHKDSVTRLLVHPTNQFFMTASKDGTVKLWDTYKPDLKTSNMSKSRSTYQGKQGGKIMDMVFCTLDYWIACLTSKDSINLINIETGDQTGTLYHEKATLSCDTNNCGHIVAISPSEYGRRTVINYATVNGHIIGWDLRANRTIFTLKHSLDKGLVTSMTSHLDEKWVAVGTSQGSITLYDMRFQLPVNSIIHGSDTGRRVNRLSSHPAESSWVVGAMAGHNELSIWNLETKQRQKMLWASSSPVFARESNRMWVNGFHVHQSSSQSFVITAGSDRNIRFWDLNQPANSALVVGGTADKVDTKVYRYKSSVVDGTDCIVESSEEVNRSTTEMGERVIRAKPQPGHHNAITDLGVYHTTHPFIVSTSATGIVKVWK